MPTHVCGSYADGVLKPGGYSDFTCCLNEKCFVCIAEINSNPVVRCELSLDSDGSLSE